MKTVPDTFSGSLVFVLLFACGEFHVAAHDELGRARKEWPSFPAVKLLASRVHFAGFNDPKLTLSDALLALQKLTDLEIGVNEFAFKLDGMENILAQRVARMPIRPMQDVPFADVLWAVVSRVAPKAIFINVGDGVEITTRWQAMVDGRKQFFHHLREISARASDVRLMTIARDTLEVCQRFGAIFYWSHVMSDNAKILSSRKR